MDTGALLRCPDCTYYHKLCSGVRYEATASIVLTTQFIGRHAVVGTGGRTMYGERDGSLAGDLDWALNLDTRGFNSDGEFDDHPLVGK